jgi:hypothetical protein
MRLSSLDVPEALIILGAVGALGLALYNWVYRRHSHPQK